MRSHHLKFGLFILLVVGAVFAAIQIGPEKIWQSLQTLQVQVKGMGTPGILVFALVFGICCLLAIPAMPFTIGSGVVFGFAGGLAASMLGAAIGGTLGFLVSRYLARDEIADKLKKNPKFQAIDAAVGKEGWKIVGLLRMCPFPYGLSNYLYGLTSIAFWPYLLSSMVGILPGICFFVYLGAAGKASLDAAGKMQHQPPGIFILIGVGLVAGLVALIYVGKVARAAVARATTSSPVTNQAELTEIPKKTG